MLQIFRITFLLLVVISVVSCNKREEMPTTLENPNPVALESEVEDGMIAAGDSRMPSIDVVLIFGGSNSLGVDQKVITQNSDVEYSYLYLKPANHVVKATSRASVTNSVGYNQALQSIDNQFAGIENRLAHHWPGKLAIVKVASFGSGIKNGFDPENGNHYRYMRGFLNQVFNKLKVKGYNPTLRLVVHVSSGSDMNDILDSSEELAYKEGLNRLMQGIEYYWGPQTKFLVTRMNYIASASQPHRDAERNRLHQIISTMANGKSNMYFANATDLELIDHVHLSFLGQIRLANRVYHVTKPF